MKSSAFVTLPGLAHPIVQPDHKSNEERLTQVANSIFGWASNATEIEIGAIHARVNGYSLTTVESTLQELRQKGLIKLGSRAVEPTPDGKTAYDLRCIPEIVLGFPYCDWKYHKAVVRICVKNKKTGDISAGTGFFVADPKHCIVTDSHVISGRIIEAIYDDTGNSLAVEDRAPEIAGPHLDLAFIPHYTPSGTVPLRVDWDETAAQPLMEILVLGYPDVAGHHPSLARTTGMIKSRTTLYRGGDSLTISRVEPGYSGAPVIAPTGLVIGVVREEVKKEFLAQSRQEGPGQDNTREQSDVEKHVTATPSSYLRELFLREGQRFWEYK